MVARNVVRLNGSLPGGEVWSNSLTFMGNFGPDVTNYADLLTWATNIGALNSGNVLPANLRGALSTAGAVTSVRVEYRDAGDNLQQAAEYTLAPTVAGTGTATKPFQTSLVCSLLTGRPGRSYRGRIFFPALGVAVSSSTLRVSNTDVLSYLAAFKSFFTGIQGAVPAGFSTTLGVASQVLNLRTAVTSLSVGEVLDVQRRRRDTLVEARESTAYP